MSHNQDNHDHDFDLDNTIILVDEEENEHVFIILEYVEVDEQEYAVLVPQDERDEGAYIFKVVSDGGDEEILMDIEDDDEFERVLAFLEADEVD